MTSYRLQAAFAVALFLPVALPAAPHLRETDDLWVTDGSEAGTRRVKDFQATPGSSGPLVQTVVGNRLLFSAQTGGVEAPLFLTDGTAAGTQILSTDASWASDFIRLGDRLLRRGRRPHRSLRSMTSFDLVAPVEL